MIQVHKHTQQHLKTGQPQQLTPKQTQHITPLK